MKKIKTNKAKKDSEENRYLLSKILTETLRKENLLTPAELKKLDELNKRSFAKLEN